MAAETGVAVGAGWKLLGGTAGAMGTGAGLAAFVVMCMTRPQSDREWRAALASTLVASVAGGAAALIKFGLLASLLAAHNDTELFVALMGLIGVVFACGLPGWMLVRAAFKWMEKREGKDLSEVAADAVSDVKRIASGAQGGGNG